MGFSDYASSLLRTNRRLLKNATRKYFVSGDNEKSPKFHKPSDLSVSRTKLAESKKKKRTIQIVLVPIIIAILISVVAYFILNRSITNHSNKTQAALIELKMDMENKERFAEYKAGIRVAQKYIARHEYRDAQIELTKALKLYPYSKKANFILTQTLLNLCISKNEDCSLAEEYYKTMMESHTLDLSEELKLEYLRDKIK